MDSRGLLELFLLVYSCPVFDLCRATGKIGFSTYWWALLFSFIILNVLPLSTGFHCWWEICHIFSHLVPCRYPSAALKFFLFIEGSQKVDFDGLYVVFCFILPLDQALIYNDALNHPFTCVHTWQCLYLPVSSFCWSSKGFSLLSLFLYSPLPPHFPDSF